MPPAPQPVLPLSLDNKDGSPRQRLSPPSPTENCLGPSLVSQLPCGPEHVSQCILSGKMRQLNSLGSEVPGTIGCRALGSDRHSRAHTIIESSRHPHKHCCHHQVTKKQSKVESHDRGCLIFLRLHSWYTGRRWDLNLGSRDPETSNLKYRKLSPCVPEAQVHWDPKPKPHG